MTTYNGAKYVATQLLSFTKQSRLPDQVVVCDDGSTDNTVEILENFARNAPFAVLVVRNAYNLGHERNFGQAIGLCDGDIIALADQDDEWFPSKLATVEKAFAENRNTLLVVNNVMITDEQLEPTGRTVIGQMKRSGLFGANGQGLTLGCATSLRKELLALVAPIPSLDFGHDSWVHEVSYAIAGRKVIPEVLQLYRRHGGNASTWGFDGKAPATPLTIMRPSVGQDLTPIWTKRLRAFGLMCERVRALGPDKYALLGARRTYEQTLFEIENASGAIARRMTVFRKGRGGRAILALQLLFRGDYRFFLGWRSFIKDLIR